MTFTIYNSDMAIVFALIGDWNGRNEEMVLNFPTSLPKGKRGVSLDLPLNPGNTGISRIVVIYSISNHMFRTKHSLSQGQTVF